MARVQPQVSNFTAGEIGPLLAGRVDQTRYFSGARKLQNCFVWRQGPATRRSGTRFIAAPKYHDRACGLIEFEYSTEQAYMIEAGHLYFRFYRNGGQIVDGGAAVEIATPYSETDLPRIKFCQSADVLYLFHPDHAPRSLNRYSHVSWALETVEWTDGPYLPENAEDGHKLAASGTSGSVTVTASGGHAPFAATDVGRPIRMKYGDDWGWLKITGYTSPTQVTADVKENIDNTNARAAWRLGLWGEANGWPVCGTFHEERLFTAGARKYPNRVDASKSNDFQNMAPGTDDDNALSYTIGANQVSAILWMESWRKLILGTRSAEFSLGGTTSGDGLTPTSVKVTRETRYGCADLAPHLVENDLIFVQRQRRKLRAMNYTIEKDGYQGDDLMLWADHIPNPGGVVDTAYCQEPTSILWGARADGVLLGCTLMRGENVTGWHRHPLGGAGAAERVASIPAADGAGGHDELWLVVRRTLPNGETRRAIERMEPPFPDDADQRDAWFVDSGLDWDAAPATVFSGLDHLEGFEVQVLADGAVHPPVTVAGGAITLSYPASRVIAGLYFPTRLETMPLEHGQPPGSTAQASARRVNRVSVRLFRSLGCKLGVSEDLLDTVPFRGGSDPMDQAPPLFTGDKEIPVEGGYDEPTVWVAQDQPLPLTVVSLVPQMSTHE